jgi:hypothetical protein
METTTKPQKSRNAKPRGRVYATEEEAVQAKMNRAWGVLSKIDPEELRKITERK